MATTVGKMQAVLDADTSGFDRGLASADRRLKSTERSTRRSMSGIGASFGRSGLRVRGFVGAIGSVQGLLAGGALVVGAKKTIDAASNLGESMNAVNVVFDKGAKRIHAWGKEAATSAGLSERAFNEAVTPIGAALRNVGLGADEAARKSIDLTQRAADMASVFNTDLSDSLGAIQAGLRGEADPLERFGVGLNETSIQAYAVKNGIAAAGAEMTNQQKIQARLGLLMEQTDRVAGDFANTSGGLANQSRILSARFENATAALGKSFMPIAISVATFLNEKAIPAFETFANFVGKVSRQKSWDMRINTIITGTGGALDKILFGSPAQRVRVPIEGGRFEWQIKGGGRGLVGAIADAIRDIDWVDVGKEIARGTKSGLEHGIQAAGFDPNKGLLPQVWPNAFGWLGAEIPKGPSGWDVLHGALGLLEDDAAAATTSVTRFQYNTSQNLQKTERAGHQFRDAMSEHFDVLRGHTGRARDTVRDLGGAINSLRSKTVDVTVNATVNMAGVTFLPGGAHISNRAQGMATGGIVQAVPGGVYRVAEGGYDEAVLSLDPALKERTYKIIGEVVKRLEGYGGLLPGFQQGGIVSRLGRLVGNPDVASVLATGLRPARAYSEALRMSSLHRPYLWGGGHAGFSAMGPWDCSGAVSEVLHAAGYPISSPMVSGALAGWGRAGSSDLMEVLANQTHAYMRIFDRSFGTSNFNPGGGFGGPLPYGVRSGFAVRTYDSGGYLPQGLSLAYNGTGRPERVGGSVVIPPEVLRGALVSGDALLRIIEEAQSRSAKRNG